MVKAWMERTDLKERESERKEGVGLMAQEENDGRGGE